MKHTLNLLVLAATDKVFFSFTAAITGLQTLLNTYVFADWQFGIYLTMLVLVDSATGTYNAWKNKTIESKAWKGVLEKFLLYGAALIMCHAMMNFTIKGEAAGRFDWLDDVVYLAMMVREAMSIIENIGEIRPNLLPKWLTSRFKKFDESGNVNDLI